MKKLLLILIAVLSIFYNTYSQCDIATNGLSLITGPGPNPPPGSIYIGQTADFVFALTNKGTSTSCVYAIGDVRVELAFPLTNAPYEFDSYVSPPGGVGPVFSWTYNSVNKVLIGVNIAPIPKNGGEADITIRVKGIAPGTAQTNLNMFALNGSTDNPANNQGNGPLTVLSQFSWPIDPIQIACGATNGSIVLKKPIAGQAPYSISGFGISGSLLVNNRDFPKTISNVPAGTYTYDITDDNGLVSSTTVTINPIPIVPNASISPTNFELTCTTPAIELIANGGGSYLWSANAGSVITSNITVSAPGTYTVTVTSTSGCTKTASATITENKVLPTVTVGSYGPACPNAPNINLTNGVPSGGAWLGTGVSGSIGSGFVFSPSAGTQTLTYTVTSANGCNNTGTTTITVEDTEKPKIVNCPGDIFESTGIKETCDAIVSWTEPSATDNCTNVAANFVWTKSHQPGDVFPVGTTIVTYTVKDEAGLESLACTFNVVVGDNSPPEIISGCPTTTETVMVNATTCKASITLPIFQLKDNCTLSSAIIQYITIEDGTTDVLAETTTIPITYDLPSGTYTITYLFKDEAGNETTCVYTVIVNKITPTFAQLDPICEGATLSALPTTSTNGITGSWSPALNNLATTLYTFTPNDANCANTANLTITVNPKATPTFEPVAAICTGATLSALPTSSTNVPAITGTWSSALNNMATTEYTFTPASTECANTANLTITVNPKATPTFEPVAAICAGATLSALPTSSTNVPAITGTWSSALNNMATTEYTFTPASTECANTATLTITVNPKVTPTFAPVPAICLGGSLSALPTTSTNGITGTWAPALDNLATTTYTFTPASTECATTASLTITVNPKANPMFEPVATICAGATLSALPTTSTNGIAGTWAPALDNSATTLYTFTPANANCANTASLTITVNPKATPTFEPVAAICAGATLSALPTTSTNGIAGTWAPDLDNMATTTYTFTPAITECATTASLTITVNPKATPTFEPVAAICAGATLYALPTTSTNGIPGTWAPALDNSATTLYTFTPTNANCANTASLTITVNPKATPTFETVAAICAGANLSALPTTSINGIAGTWAPALDNMATTTYTFTPAITECATTASLTITVNPKATPTFEPVAAICAGATLSALPTTSNNGIIGTWSPALNNMATTTYTFTPAITECATTASLTITVNPKATPTFEPVATICAGATLSALPTTSTNGIAGTWAPAMDNMATTTYTFTPASTECATTASLTITVNPNATPTFEPVAAICAGATFSSLPTTSTNGIAGTWAPALDNMTTTTYTFTPASTECATTASLTITVNPKATPTFEPVAAICAGATLSALPTSSTNVPAITGSWSPALNNMATTEYTFTPASTECATTASLTITVNVNNNKVVVSAPDGNQCPGSNIVIDVNNANLAGTNDDFDFNWVAKDALGVTLGSNALVNLGNASINTTLGLACGQTINNPITFTINARNDANGCLGMQKQVVVTIKDEVPPVITCPPNVVYENLSEASCTYTFLESDLSNLRANDNCSGDNLEMTYTIVKPDGTTTSPAGVFSSSNGLVGKVFTQGFSIVKLIATDLCGNSATCNFTVIVRCKTEAVCTNWSEDFGGAFSADGCPTLVLDDPTAAILTALNGSSKKFGSTTRSFELKVNDVTSGAIPNLLFDATGASAPLGLGNASYDTPSTWAQVPLNAGPASALNPIGMINNKLLTRTIALWINLQNSNTLDAVPITNNMWTQAVDCNTGLPLAGTTVLTQMPDAVVSFLFANSAAYPQNADGLFKLGNALLGGEDIGTPNGTTIPSLAEVELAIANINGAFRSCRVLLTADIVVNGTIYNDDDGMTDGIIDFTPGSPLNGTDVNGNPLHYFTIIQGDAVNVAGENTGQIIKVISIDANGSYELVPLVNGTYTVNFGDNPLGNRKPKAPTGKVFAGEGGRLSELGDLDATTGSQLPLGFAIGDGLANGRVVVTVNGSNPPVYANAKVAAPLAPLPPLNFGIANEALPVRLVSFTGQPTIAGNELNWKTTAEENFSHYEIERSLNAKIFKPIGKVLGANTKNQENLSYSFIDDNQSGSVPGASSGNTVSSFAAYYRLKMVDLDGSFQYSKIIFINDDSQKSIVGEFYPNPAVGSTVSINIKGDSNSAWKITSYDISGREINTETKMLNYGDNKVELDLKTINNGITIFRFENNKTIHFRKLNR
jgi:hypothetical protein